MDLQLGVDLILVAAPDALTSDVAGGAELGDDPVRGALGDPHLVADLAYAHSRVIRDADQNLGVVGQELPAWNSRPRHEQQRISGGAPLIDRDGCTGPGVCGQPGDISITETDAAV